MIPKIIHFCWFGTNPLSEEVKNYIETWKKHLPDYEIKMWNEDNFNYNEFDFSREAYQKKKYAFVSDFCRLFVLAKHGGIYLDTDVEVLKSFDDLLNQKAFMGYEDFRMIGTSVIGSEPNSEFISEILQIYKTKKFILENNKIDVTPNVVVITDYLKEKNVITDGGVDNYDEKLTIYPRDYFSPKVFDTKKINITENTYSIHHFSQSWTSLNHQIIQIFKTILVKIIGFDLTRKIIDYVKK